jgi:hypothetical protein
MNRRAVIAEIIELLEAKQRGPANWHDDDEDKGDTLGNRAKRLIGRDAPDNRHSDSEFVFKYKKDPEKAARRAKMAKELQQLRDKSLGTKPKKRTFFQRLRGK